MSLIFFVFYFACFFLIQLLLLFLWKPCEEITRNVDFTFKVSILIAVRNEEKNIVKCLESIESLDYPKDLIEILIGNDQSEDQSEKIIRAYIQNKPNFKLINITEQPGKLRGKANVLAQLAQQAQGDLYLLTDADITVAPSWIKGMISVTVPSVGVISGITLVKGKNYFSRFQCMDMTYAFGMVKTVSDLNIPVTSIGNNMLVSAEAYKSTGGYENIPFSITEDFQLFREIVMRGWGFRNLIQSDVLSLSTPIKKFSQLLDQRKRWMRGALKLPILLVLVLGMQALFFPLIIITLFFFPFLGIVIWWFKIICQNIFIYRLLRRVNYNFSLLKYAIPYELYSGILSITLLVYYFIPGKIAWKGRRY